MEWLPYVEEALEPDDVVGFGKMVFCRRKWMPAQMCLFMSPDRVPRRFENPGQCARSRFVIARMR